MSFLILGLAAALASTNPAVAVSNVVEKTTGISVPVISTNDPVEIALQRVMDDDDAAQAEADKWIHDADAFAEKGADNPRSTLKMRIRQRLDVVQKEYNDFIQLHPDNPRARLAFGSFLSDSGDEDGAALQWEKARELDPKNPAPWNNLANHYGHEGPIKKAFEYFDKAIELNPHEPLYYQNLATHVYLFRKDAKEYYHLTETEVFDKALALYRKAIKLDPQNFILATDYAQSFYGTNPPRLKDGLEAWKAALIIARDEVEREGVYIHLARIETKLGQMEVARRHLDSVTNAMYNSTKKTLTRNLDDAIQKLQSTNASVQPTNAAPLKTP